MIQAVAQLGNGFYFLFIFFYIYVVSLRKIDYLCTQIEFNIIFKTLL